MSRVLQPTLFRTCRVLANSKRLQIIALLIRQPNQSVSRVAQRLGLSLPTASQYLRALEARGLLNCRRIGRHVKYRLCVTAATEPAAKFLPVLRLALRHRGQSIETIFKLATAFTHPRRLEVFCALTNGSDSVGKLHAATRISTRALVRHLAKLEARGFIKVERNLYVVAIPAHPFGRVLASLAVQ